MNLTHEAHYTPGDQVDGLAKVGEIITFAVLANNTGNVDIGDATVYNEGDCEINI